MLEKRIKQAVKKRLKELGAYYFMPVQVGLGAVTLDFLICYKGRFFMVETKRPGGKPTALQKIVIEKARAAGAVVFVVDSIEGADALFK